MADQDYYEVLGVSRTATADEIMWKMRKEPPPVGGKLCETCGGAKKNRLLWEAALGDLVTTQ